MSGERGASGRIDDPQRSGAAGRLAGNAGSSVPTGPAGEPGKAWTCALCGYRSPGGFPQCAGCAMMASCRVNHCPNCGYQFVESSVILTWISRAVHGIMRMTRRGREKVAP